MASIEASASLFFAGVFHYGTVAKAARAFGIPRTTYSDIVRSGKLGGKTKPTIYTSEKTKEKVLEKLYDPKMREDRIELGRIRKFFREKLSTNQLRALKNERGEDSFYNARNLEQAVRKFESEPTKRNPALIRALREIGY